MTGAGIRSGNRCGHDPRNIRTQLAKRPRRRPKFIRRAISKAQRYAFDPKRILARLERPRSERREAVGLVVMLLLAYTDRLTDRIGLPCETSDDGWKAIQRHHHIGKGTALSLSRIDRARAMLRTVGYLSRDGQPRRWNEIAGRWENEGAREHWTPAFWHDIGLALAHKLDTAKAYQEHKAKAIEARRQETHKQRRLRLRREALAGRARGVAVALEALGQAAEGEPWPDEPSPRLERRGPPAAPPSRWQTIQREIEAAHPEWPPDAVWHETRRRLEES